MLSVANRTEILSGLWSVSSSIPPATPSPGVFGFPSGVSSCRSQIAHRFLHPNQSISSVGQISMAMLMSIPFGVEIANYSHSN